ISAALVRASAEANDQAPKFNSIPKEFQKVITVQMKIHEQKKRTLNDELGVLNDSLRLAQEELRMHEALLRTGDISRLEVMNARRKVNDLQGKIHAERNKYRQEARQEVAKLEEELSMSNYKLEEKRDVLEHTVLKAPVAGVVKYLKITTIGGVLRSGDELMQISPSEDDMIVEIKVNPVDIGQLKPGLPATIKLDAFDYSIFGALQGLLSYISSDTLTEQDGGGQIRMFYRASVRIQPQDPQSKLAHVPLKPGMTATVDIRTDRRSVLQYLAKPIFKAFSGAMIER
ncbi:MAG: HlyD family efflux transporter periplasmic adaptor subunit, partial [Magnetococcales bacterium]|nr:HlyD family efflux transporter periplasmic adaptor subunit [Magnetococcales bacterium]